MDFQIEKDLLFLLGEICICVNLYLCFNYVLRKAKGLRLIIQNVSNF